MSAAVMRVAAALAPLVALLGAVTAAALVYTWRARRGAPFHDEEMDQRGLGGFTGPGLRHFFAWLVRPLWQGLARARFPPDVLTTLSVAVGLGAGASLALGRFALGGWLFLGAGLLDFLDGRVARATGRVTRGGAALDSILDRYVESAALCGLAWYYRTTWVLAPALLALTGSLFVSYARARGEALGVSLKDVGLMQRPERILLIGAGTVLSPVFESLAAPDERFPWNRPAVAALVVVAVAAHATAVRRILHVRNALEGNVTTRSFGRAFRSGVSNGIATLGDFVVALVVFHWLGRAAAVATALGCVVGAALSYSLGRLWTFETRSSTLRQLARYALAWILTGVMNAGGVELLYQLHLPFLAAWVVARAVVFTTWSYPIQRDFVFSRHPLEEPAE